MQVEGGFVSIIGEVYTQQLIRVIDAFNLFIKKGGDPDQFKTKAELA